MLTDIQKARKKERARRARQREAETWRRDILGIPSRPRSPAAAARAKAKARKAREAESKAWRELLRPY